MTRPIPAVCEVCGTFPPASAVGFPGAPGVLPNLPKYLRGASLWICRDPACDLQAQRRAVEAAAAYGITLTQIWRQILPSSSALPSERTET